MESNSSNGVSVSIANEYSEDDHVTTATQDQDAEICIRVAPNFTCAIEDFVDARFAS